MALLRFHCLSPQILPQPMKLQAYSFSSTTHISTKSKTLIRCSNSVSDAELASDLASEVQKRNTHLAQRTEAIKKSRELLFTELCRYLALRQVEVKRKWGKMNEDEKWILVKGFVSEWDVDFHPLSSKSVKELVEDYLEEECPTSPSPSPSLPFSGLRRMMGFSPNK